ncbi:MAG: TonB family protein [Terriglobales bacterium]
MPITLKDENNLSPPAPRADVKQRKRMLLALAVLLIAVIVVLIKDHELWFAAAPEPDSSGQSGAATGPPGPVPTIPAAETATPGSATAPTKKHSAPRVSSAAAGTPVAPPMISATERAVLPPLEVEVVAGNQRQALAASNSAVKVEMQPAAGAGQASTGAPIKDANSDAKVSLSPSASERVTRSVQPNYPLLAKQMKVQGAVVLQALIDKTGNIEDLHVVSGPTILAAAAREAVKQWHFKPYYQAGQAVETEARITVNFTISTY